METHFPLCSFVVLPPSAMSKTPCWLEKSEELLKSMALSITSGSSDVEGDTLFCHSRNGKKDKGVTARNWWKPLGTLQGGRVLFCNKVHLYPGAWNAISKSSSVKTCVSLLSFGRDLCPSDLDKAQEITGAKDLADTSSSSLSLALECRQVAKVVPLGLSPSG